MDHKQMPYGDFREVLLIRLRSVRELSPGDQDVLAENAWKMVQRGVPWQIALTATRLSALARAAAGNPGAAGDDGWPAGPGVIVLNSESGPPGLAEDPCPVSVIEDGDLAVGPPPPLRHEVARDERERLSATTRQTLRMARHARRWHEIRKMRSVLMGIDQAYLKRMLGAESEPLRQEINALLRSWAPLVRERRRCR